MENSASKSALSLCHTEERVTPFSSGTPNRAPCAAAIVSERLLFVKLFFVFCPLLGYVILDEW